MQQTATIHIMSSNSVRISGELFERAREQGEIQSRSTSQQIEHWAKIGIAVEAAGLSVNSAVQLLTSAGVERRSEAALWASKRAQQSQELQAVRSGEIAANRLAWFSDGRAKAAKLVDSPL